MIHYITSSGVGQPWVANELRTIERAGVPFKLHAMRKPQSVHFTSVWAHELNDSTNVLYPLTIIGTVVSMIAAPLFFRRRFFRGLINALFGKRENGRGRIASIAHFFVACHWARQLRSETVSHIHSQWAYSSATIGMYAAWLLGKPFSFTGHGTDLWRDRVALEDKIRRAEFIACISNFHYDLYLKHGARPEQLYIVYCGIDVQHFSPPMSNAQTADGIIHIRSSGRLVEKKGFRYLIEACKILADKEIGFECTIAGSGPLEQELRELIHSLDLNDCVTVTGKALKQENIADFAHSGTVYCLPCVWASDNDADGLPQMLMEAMACGLPAVSTRLVGIPDLIIDGQTGLLIDPNDACQIAQAILRIANDRDFAQKIAKAGREHILHKFELNSSLQPLTKLFRNQLKNNKKI